jgi:hypothetical protein
MGVIYYFLGDDGEESIESSYFNKERLIRVLDQIKYEYVPILHAFRNKILELESDTPDTLQNRSIIQVVKQKSKFLQYPFYDFYFVYPEY